MTAPRLGDRVRVVVEGNVTATLTNGTFHVEDHCWWFNDNDNKNIISVEVLAPPEPEWQPGDVVRDATGEVFVRAANMVWMHGQTRLIDLYPCRPLTRLVPEQSA